MASPSVTEPPGEFTYRAMSRSESSAASRRSWAHTMLATVSSMEVPRKMMRSLRSRWNTSAVAASGIEDMRMTDSTEVCFTPRGYRP